MPREYEINTESTEDSFDAQGNFRVSSVKEKQYSVDRKIITVPVNDPNRDYTHYEIMEELRYACSNCSWTFPIDTAGFPGAVHTAFGQHRPECIGEFPILMKVLDVVVASNAVVKHTSRAELLKKKK